MQWELRLANEADFPGFVGVEVESYTKGPQPQDWVLVAVETSRACTMDEGAQVEIPRGVPWWSPGKPLK